jgi:hypothetical protein
LITHNCPNQLYNMAYIPSKIERIASEGYLFRLSDYLSSGFSIIQKDIGGFIGYTVLYGLITIMLQIIPLLGPMANAVISPALAIGPMIVAHKISNNQPHQFSDFFTGFQKIGDLFVVTILTGLMLLPLIAIVAIVIIVADGGIGGGMLDNSDTVPFALLVMVLLFAIVAVYVVMLFSQAANFVWFYNLSAWDAMMSSRKIVQVRFWDFLVFAIVIGIIAGAGLLLLCVGILFTLPAMQCAQYAAFADVTQLNEDDTTHPDDHLIDHFAPMG